MNQTATTTLPDGGLAAFLLNRDTAALEELLSHYQPRIFSIANRIVKNHHDAQEITQDTLFAIYRKIGTFRGDSSICTWIYRIALNNTLMKLRYRRREPQVRLDEPRGQDGEEPFLADVIADKGKFADEQIVERELVEKILHTLDGLPDKYRQIMRLEIFREYSNAELGQRLNLSVPAVKSRLHRARLLLREKTKPFIGSSN